MGRWREGWFRRRWRMFLFWWKNWLWYMSYYQQKGRSEASPFCRCWKPDRVVRKPRRLQRLSNLAIQAKHQSLNRAKRRALTQSMMRNWPFSILMNTFNLCAFGMPQAVPEKSGIKPLGIFCRPQ